MSARRGLRAAASAWLVQHWYGRRPPPALRPLAFLFGVAVRLRRTLYRRGILRTVHLPVRVVVVGNITAGGSGKTPLVRWLAQRLAARGLSPAIVTRGYGGGERGPRLVTGATPVSAAGDEAVWLARASGVPVAAGRDRAAAARLLIARYHPDVIIADDGLQHYRLGRDAEIVAVDAERGFGNGALLPAGPLREPPARLSGAAAIVLKGAGSPPLPAGPPVLRPRIELGPAIRLADGLRRALTEFRGHRVSALAAIADPESFFRALEAAGLAVEGRGLPDHADVAAAAAGVPGDRPLFMTDKDAVKLAAPPSNAWRVPLALAFSEADEAALVAIAAGQPRPGEARS